MTSDIPDLRKESILPLCSTSVISSYISNLLFMPTERVAITSHHQMEAIAESYSWTHVRFEGGRLARAEEGRERESDVILFYLKTFLKLLQGQLGD